MTDDSKTVDMEDLDKFEDAFFKRPTEDKQEVSENEDDALDTSEDEDAEHQENENEPDEEDEDLEETDEEEEDEEPAPPVAKKGKKSFKERIDEITAEKYELKRQLQELQSQMESRSNEGKQKEAPKALREQLSEDAPNPDAKDEDGEPIYPLGEFDPRFIRDITKFSVAQELKAAEEQRQRVAAAAQEQQRISEMTTSWNEKLDKAEESIPDIRGDISDLVEVFQDLDPQYGDYLAATIMSLDNGPAVMHYLSQNIGEAQKIVASGPQAATIAIGRIDARLEPGSEEKRNKRVSTAKEPPAHQNRGQGGKFAVSGDTDDLDAFERVFFKKPVHPFGRR